MDSDDSSFSHERIDKGVISGRKLPYYQQHPMILSYGLIALSYILILALLIIIVSSSSNEGSKPNTYVLTEISFLQVNITELSSKVIQMEKATYKVTCKKGWVFYNNYCYYISLVTSSWMKARSSCIEKGSDLVVITSEEEQIFLMSIINMKNEQKYWIGLSDEEEEGKWTWVDGTDYDNSFKFWKQGEPNNYMKNEDCAHLWTNGEWNDIRCTFDLNYAICEQKLS